MRFSRSLKIAAICALLVAPLALWLAGEDPEERARRIHSEAIVIDTHADTLQRVLYGGVDLGDHLPDGHVDIPRLRQGGVDGQFFALWVDSIFAGPAAVKQTLRLIDAMNRVLEKHPDKIALARSADELEAINKSGRIAALLGIEGGHAIDDDLRVLRVYYNLGVRYMTLTWSNANNWADSSREERHGGLTEFGKEVVREMNRLGMIVDISHVSDKTFYDVLKVATRPVIASHSSCRALAANPRNMTDDMIRALARNGGVIGINFYSAFIDDDYARRARSGQSPSAAERLNPKSWAELERLAAERYKRFETPSKIAPPPMERVLDHIDHVVKLVGADHVGLGSDYDGIDSAPAGLEDVSRLPNITRGLLRRGYSERDIKKILGGNFLRVLRANQQ